MWAGDVEEGLMDWNGVVVDGWTTEQGGADGRRGLQPGSWSSVHGRCRLHSTLSEEVVRVRLVGWERGGGLRVGWEG